MNNLPIISVEKIEEQQDGSAKITFHYEESLIEFIIKETGIAAPSQEEIGKFILDMIENAVNKKDGWDLEKT